MPDFNAADDEATLPHHFVAAFVGASSHVGEDVILLIDLSASLNFDVMQHAVLCNLLINFLG